MTTEITWLQTGIRRLSGAASAAERAAFGKCRSSAGASAKAQAAAAVLAKPKQRSGKAVALPDPTGFARGAAAACLKLR